MQSSNIAMAPSAKHLLPFEETETRAHALSDDARMCQIFKEWMRHHGKRYSSKYEKKKRF